MWDGAAERDGTLMTKPKKNIRNTKVAKPIKIDFYTKPKMKSKVKKKKTASQVGKFSRSKGKRFERQMARYFTKWTGLNWQTTRNSGRTDLKGDIYCLDFPDAPIVVECKDRKTYTVHAMLKPTKAFRDMVLQTILRAVEVEYTLILVKNETATWVALAQFGKFHLPEMETHECGIVSVQFIFHLITILKMTPQLRGNY